MTEAPRHKPSLESVAALSHEFRTPLNGVLGMAQLLESTRLSAEQKAYVAVLKESGAHLLKLVNDLLDLAKIEAGTLSLTPAPVNPAALLQSVCELLSPRAQAKRIEIAWTSGADIPVVMADEGRLRQVLLNLAGNAIKFTEFGGALITVEARGKVGKTARLRFCVHDSGPGVTDDERERIFQAFEQGADHASRPDSTGLGLAVVQRLADAHGGRVGVNSMPGHGSTFWFEAEFEVCGAAAFEPRIDDQMVVVVSANGMLAEAARGHVEAYGGVAVVAGSIAEARDLVEDGCVVLIDHALRQSGQIRPFASNPCLIMVAPEERGCIAAYKQAGFAGYLIKPLRPVSIAERVRDVTGVNIFVEARDERAEAETAPGARVLLVEDNPVNALLARKLLEREGCAVDWVTSGEMALGAVAVGHDLILMDRRLPGLDGLETTVRLRGQGVETPIVALTADAFDEDRRACLAAGMDDFLVKPLDPAALRAVLSRAGAGGWTKHLPDAKLAS